MIQGYLFAAACMAVFAVSMIVLNGILQRRLEAAAGYKAAKTVLCITAGVYFLTLIYLLFFLPAARESMTTEAYFGYGRLNLIPFATVRRYINAIKRGIIPLTSAVNLLGNLLLFLPMGVLLAVLSKPFSRFYCGLPLLLLTVAAVELLQLYFLIGSCDIDDLILNFLGGCLGFVAAKLPFIRRFLARQRFIS